jgi:D-psicose/D-tagatose/L-ribulose 3-epimerase
VKIGFDMMLWTTHVTEAHRPLLEDIERTGYDGVEIPVFEGNPDHYARVAGWLREAGLGATTVAIVQSLDANPLSPDPAVRREAVRYLRWLLDCVEAVGASVVGGPLHQTLGHFSGNPPTEDERARAREVHREVGEIAARKGVTIALEAVNRFECYFANTMDELCRYVDSVGHPNIKAMYDTFHANIEERDPVGAYTRNARNVVHVHISENDRGVPGRGNIPWAETFQALRESGYDGWLTIETFGRALPALAAATKIWRDLSKTPEEVYRDGFRHIRNGWAAAAPRRAPAGRARKSAAKPRRSAAGPKRSSTPKRGRSAKPSPRRTTRAGIRKRPSARRGRSGSPGSRRR